MDGELWTIRSLWQWRCRYDNFVETHGGCSSVVEGKRCLGRVAIQVQWIRQVEPKFNKLNSCEWSKADDGFNIIDRKDDHKPPNQAIDRHDGCRLLGSSSSKY